MASTTITSGIKISFGNTPQAGDDLLSFSDLTEDNTTGIHILDVMSNDLGGAAKSLYSLDDGTSTGGIRPDDLLAKDAVGAVNYSKFGAIIKITADGKVSYDASAWTSEFKASLQHLAEGESFTDSFTYAIRLANGALSWATASVAIKGENDAPVITNVASDLVGSVTEDDATSISGQLSASDVDHGATQTWSVQGNNAGTYGSIAVDAATGKWTYTLANDAANVQALAAGESHDETFTVRVTDDKGAFVNQTVTVTVNGTNDAPVVTNATSELAGSVKEDDATSVSGQLSASDVDHGATQAWTVQGNNAGTYGSIAVDAATGQWTYTLNNDAANVQALAAGENHDETFTVRVTDDQGAFVDQTVTITVNGTNDAPVITNTATELAGSVKEDDTASVTGQLSVSDVDHGATQAWSVQGNDAGTYGSIAVDAATGQWTYTLNNDAANVQALAAGESHDETFTVRVTDDQGAFVDQTVTITVNGTNEAPVIPPAPVKPTVDSPYTGPDADPNDFDTVPSGVVASGPAPTNGQDTLIGTSANNTVNLLNGADTYYGGAGNDVINGNNGVDTIYGQAGNDVISGDSANDYIYGGSGNDTLYGENTLNNVTGVSNDVIYGGSGADVIDGGDGTDVIIGGYGADTLTGGSGNDTFKYLDIRDTGDTITDFSHAQGDKLDFSAISGIAGTASNSSTVTAHSINYFADGANTIVWADTDGNTSTVEIQITLTGVAPANLSATDFIA